MSIDVFYNFYLSIYELKVKRTIYDINTHFEVLPFTILCSIVFVQVRVLRGSQTKQSVAVGTKKKEESCHEETAKVSKRNEKSCSVAVVVLLLHSAYAS